MQRTPDLKKVLAHCCSSMIRLQRLVLRTQALCKTVDESSAASDSLRLQLEVVESDLATARLQVSEMEGRLEGAEVSARQAGSHSEQQMVRTVKEHQIQTQALQDSIQLLELQLHAQQQQQHEKQQQPQHEQRVEDMAVQDVQRGEEVLSVLLAEERAVHQATKLQVRIRSVFPMQ